MGMAKCPGCGREWKSPLVIKELVWVRCVDCRLNEENKKVEGF